MKSPALAVSSPLSGYSFVVRCAIAAIIAGLAIGGGGCASGKPAVKPDPATKPPTKTAASPEFDFPVNHDDWSALGYRLAWVGYPVERSAKTRVVAAAAFPDALILQDSSSEVALLDSLTGERRWGVGLANPLTRFVGIVRDPLDKGRVVVSSQSEGFVMAVATGGLVAKESYEKVVNTKPLVVGGMLVFGTSTGEVLAHLMGRNVKAWGFQTGSGIDVNPVLFNDGVIGSISQSGDVVILNSSGQMLGRNRVLGGLANNPVTDGNYLFAASTDQSVWAFTQSGGLLWRYRTAASLTGQIAVHAGAVYVFVPRDGMTALESTTGKVLWTAKDVEGDVIAVVAGKLLVRTPKGIDAIDPVNGAVTRRVAMPGVVRFIPESMKDPTMYAVSDLGVVAKFIPRQ